MFFFRFHFVTNEKRKKNCFYYIFRFENTAILTSGAFSVFIFAFCFSFICDFLLRSDESTKQNWCQNNVCFSYLIVFIKYFYFMISKNAKAMQCYHSNWTIFREKNIIELNWNSIIHKNSLHFSIINLFSILFFKWIIIKHDPFSLLCLYYYVLYNSIKIAAFDKFNLIFL